MTHIVAPFLFLTSAWGILLSLERRRHAVGRTALPEPPKWLGDEDVPLPFPDVILETTLGRVCVYRRADAIPRHYWDEKYPPQWKAFDFYWVVDETMTHQFKMRYLVLEDKEEQVESVQPVFFVEQNLIDEIPDYLNWLQRLLKSLFPRLAKTKILMVGSPVAEGHLGGGHHERPERIRAALEESLEAYARREGVALIVLKDLAASYRASLESFRRHGYTRLAGFPWTKLALNFDSFEDYMKRKVSQKMRRDLRLKFRKSGNAGLEFEVVSDITKDAARIHELYLQVAQRSAVQFDVLTEGYFALVGQCMPDRARFFLWRRDGEIVAFTYCIVDGDSIYDNDIGLDYSIALDLHLYFITRRDMIQWAIEQGLTTYFCSPFGYDPKLHMKMDLVPMDLYVRHRCAPVNWMLRRFAPRFAPARSEPLLRRFANYSDLY